MAHNYDSNRHGPPELSISTDFRGIKNWDKIVGILSTRGHEAAYARAHAALKGEVEKLVSHYGWVWHSAGQDLFHVSRVSSSGQRTHFRLPMQLASFATNAYDLIAVFHPLVKRFSADKIDLSLSDPPPLETIFYILQVVASGFLTIHYSYEYDAYGELAWERVFPQPWWLEQNHDFLVYLLLDDPASYETILNTSRRYEPSHLYHFYDSRVTHNPETWPHIQGGFPRLPTSLLIGHSYTE
ncbi:hypothetical protein M413DRAFT_447623 [Hebeloma cylindrosporum]|uniref:Uncharacterized protein n=1 Tax=Hebeloma cylindrosporum TaxID=76867 RepID=A0A0C3C311_HEBCY|nr:hypothetical protein M413DRAFT_447623 [Hebeloma cylindrosporum h7]